MKRFCLNFKLRKLCFWLLLALIAYFLAAVLPYASPSEISAQDQSRLAAVDFYGQPGVAGDDRVGLVEQPETGADARLHMLATARQSIDLSYYSTYWGQSTEQFFGSLLAAADRGVKVRFLVDGLANHLDGSAGAAACALAVHPNIELKFYNPVELLRPWRINSRLHDKYIIVDNQMLLLGGRNVGDKYFNTVGFPGQLSIDRDVFVLNTSKDLTYSVIGQVKAYFAELWGSDDVAWAKSSFTQAQLIAAELEKNRLLELVETLGQQRPALFTPRTFAYYLSQTWPAEKVTLIANPTGVGPKAPWAGAQISRLLLQARKEVLLQSPYVVLDPKMLALAKESGQDLLSYRLLTNSAASSPNLPAFSGYSWQKSELLETGIEIYEYQGDYSLHGKSAVIDGQLSLVGSFNWDCRSAYINTEVVLAIQSQPFSQALTQAMEGYMGESLKVKSTGINQGSTEVYPVKAAVSPVKKFLILFLSVATRPFRFLL